MTITLDDPQGVELPPVLDAKELGQVAVGALVKAPEWRDILVKNDAGELVPVVKPNGKHRQELVITLVVMPDTTTPVSRKGESWAATPGDVARIIVRGKSASEYIDAKKALGGAHQVGDVFTHRATHAVAYQGKGVIFEDNITDPARLVEHQIKRTVGIYGPLTVRRATPDEAQWVQAAEAAHHASREPIALADDELPAGNVEGF